MNIPYCRSQWQIDLWHELSSPAKTLGRISATPSFVFVLSYVGSGPATGLITSLRSPTDCL
jgi:hypothetical protein